MEHNEDCNLDKLKPNISILSLFEERYESLYNISSNYRERYNKLVKEYDELIEENKEYKSMFEELMKEYEEKDNNPKNILPEDSTNINRHKILGAMNEEFNNRNFHIVKDICRLMLNYENNCDEDKYKYFYEEVRNDLVNYKFINLPESNKI